MQERHQKKKNHVFSGASQYIQCILYITAEVILQKEK